MWDRWAWRGLVLLLLIQYVYAGGGAPTVTVADGDKDIAENNSPGDDPGWFYTASGDATRYELSGADASVFDIVAATGVITINTALDADGAQTVYKPELIVYDVSNTPSTPILTLTLTVTDVNDNTPICNPNLIYKSANENDDLGGAALLTLACSDADKDSPNNDIEYSFVTAQTDFGVGTSTGDVTITNGQNYETLKKVTLKIDVFDKGGTALTSTATVVITLNGLNDVNPAFNSLDPAPDSTGPDTYNVAEDTAIGTSLFKSDAGDDDDDVGDSLTYSISNIKEVPSNTVVTDVFSIDPITGEVHTQQALDADNGVTGYVLTVKVSDGDVSHDQTRDVTITLTNVNDNNPEFTGVPSSAIVIAETAALTNSVVTTLTAQDDDASSTFTFTVGAIILGNSVVADWKFNAGTPGQLQFAANIDYDAVTSKDYNVIRVVVADQDGNTGTGTVTVSISPVNEHTPTATFTTASPQTIAENTAIGTSINQVNGADSDKGDDGVLVYSIDSGNVADAFRIDADTGKVYVQKTLDKETLDDYNLAIDITDSGTVPKSIQKTLNVKLSNINDNTPECSTLFAAVDVREDGSINDVVTGLTAFVCADDDGDVITYTVLAPESNTFKIAGTDLALKTTVDYETTKSYLVQIQAADPGGQSTTVKVSVTITAVNEDTPSFATNPSFDKDENSATGSLTTYTATDDDDSPHDIVSYSIFSVSNSGSSLFGIDSSTGEISIVGNLDYDTLPTGNKKYELVIKARDGGGLEGSGTVTLDVNDLNDIPPTCSQSVWNVALDETQSGSGPWTVVNALGCSDPDGTSLTYTFSQSNPSATFVVAADKVTLTANDMDYENANLHTLTITVTDAGSQAIQVIVNVIVNNVNDGPPVFTASTAVDRAENLAVSSTIATVAAVDPDGTDAAFGDVQYSIQSGDDDSQFSIDVSSGEIVLQKPLDFETKTTYTLVIKAKERQGSGSVTANQVVNVLAVNDNSPTCSPNTLYETVPEDSAVNYVIRALGCTDTDAGTTLSYTITTGDTTIFEINSANLRLKKKLDFETAQSHDISITVSDGDASHNFVLAGTITVGSVDEGQPSFSKTIYPKDVSESENVGYLVETVTATDPDSNLDSNGQVVFSFVSTYSSFNLDSSTGKVTLAKQLDRESGTLDYELQVRASDATGSVIATVTITVTDQNDNTPIFNPSSYLGTISESDGSGTTVLTVTANDADDPSTNNYGTVTYSLSGTGSTDFSIDASSGEITSAAVMNADTIPSYSLTVTATDSGGSGGALSSSTSVVISVTKINQNDPAFQVAPYTRTITENELNIGDEIIKVTATDVDSGDNGDVTISFVIAPTKFALVQTGDVGSIKLAEALDFESGDTSFVINIQAADGGSPPKAVATTVTITVNDDNDNSPLCTSVLNVVKDEGQTSVATLVCNDADAGTTLTYVIDSTTPGTITPSVNAAGVVSVASALDYETDDSYVIKVKVSDDGAPIQSTTVTINLYVNDLNDNDPSFAGAPFTFNINEGDTADGTVLLTATASSNDGPTDTITYSLSSNTYFDVTTDSGKITLKGTAPDRETVGATTTFQVCAADTANPTVRNKCETVTVNIADANDNTPVFNPTVYTATVAENTGTGISIGRVTAADADVLVAFNAVSFTITAGNTGTAFSVGLSDGIVKVASTIDYETTKSYSLTIQASDGTLTSTIKFEITVTSVNEFDPTFSPGTQSINVDENKALATSVFKAAATDADDGADGDFTYSIDSGPFAIDPTSGEITVSGELDREGTTLYTLNVRATDQGGTPRVGTLVLTITIDDLNDKDPTCSSNPYSASVAENAVAGAAVATLVCTDADNDPNNINNDLTYTLSTHTTLFQVDTSGVVTVKSGASFDRETTDGYTVKIDVKDKPVTGKRSFSATISVIITDINDNDPAFTTLSTTVNIEESRGTGSTIGSGAATDADIGLNGDLSYSLTNGNTGTAFQIDSGTGVITLIEALDFETTQSYDLEVTVTDKGGTPRSVSSTLTVAVTNENDVAPVCGTSFYSASLAENSVSQPVVTVACTDSDGVIAYSITSGDTNNDFVISSSTGALTSRASANLDFETKKEYTLTVQASDGVQTDTTTVKVFVTDVNEAPPAFTPAGPYTKTVSEDAAVDLAVMTLAATDPDTEDTIKIFTITGGNGAAKFYLDASSGDVKVQGPLDRETTPSYSLTVQVADSGGSISSTTLTINLIDVNDNSPTCTDTTKAVDVDEGVSTGDLYLPSCSDLDIVATPTLAYSISSGTNAALSLDTATGRLFLAAAFDYETIQSHVVVIEVSDQDTPTPKTTQINVQITINPSNEHDPIFTAASAGPFSVAENAPTSTAVGTVSADDADTGLFQGIVRYSIVGGDPLGQFGIDQNSGDLTVVKALDRETTASYTLTIRASDDVAGSGSVRTADVSTTINVQDANDVTPTFNPSIYSVNVYEDATFGAAVVLLKLTVSDTDTGVNGDMDITITSGNAESKFSISGTDITLVAALDYETTISYELVLEVADRGLPQLKSTARAVVNVLPINERAPLMNVSSASASIAEDVAIGSLVYDANATDIDIGLAGQITYSIDSGVPSGEFFVDTVTGKLFVSSVLDYDTSPNTYAIIIRASDGEGLTAATSTVSLDITLTDVNDNYPQFPSSIIPFSVNENENANHVVGTVAATDQDTGVNGQVNYTKTGGNGNTFFDIEETTGNIIVIGSIDYETSQVYYLSITAGDNGNPSLVSNGLVKINIQNMNDNDPVITPEEFAVLVDEDVLPGHSVHTFSATDVDTAINSFDLSAPDSFFQIDSSSGKITTKAALDRETNAEHVLNITIIDRPTGSDTTVRTSTATLTIVIQDINDNDPAITGTYTPSVSEDASVNVLVFKMTASDDDAGANAQLVYSIDAGDPNNQFRIDSQGNVQVNKALDRETTPSYTLTIKVSDKGTPPRADQRDITVTIDDVNDNDPVFTLNPYTMNVAENSKNNDPVGTVVATDADQGVNAALTYSFDSFTVGTASHFAIDGATGAITVASTAIDRETQDTYTVNVKVTDAGTPLARSALTVVNINIDDLNDNAPVFSSLTYDGEVDENAALTTSILTVVSTDRDIDENANVTYSIDTSSAEGVLADTYLEVNNVTGEFSPKQNIDYEVYKSFSFTVVATDGGDVPLTATANVTVTIKDVNDNRPIFSPTFFDTEIAYNAVCDNSIATLTATDADSGVNALISYSILTVDNAFLLNVNTATGQIYLQAVAQENKIYTYEFRASDSGNPILTSVTPATVRIDTFVPNNNVVTIRLTLSRVDFEAQKATFLTNMQTLLRTVHAQAIPRIWCVEEYSGTAQSPGATRRRLLQSSNPVDVHLLALLDDTSSTIANIAEIKQLLTQDQLYALLAADAQGTPGSGLLGAAWDNLNIVKILQYYDEPDDWWDTLYGKIITAIAAFLALVFVILLVYAIFVCCDRKSHPFQSRRRAKVRVTEVSPSPTESRIYIDEDAWKPNKGPVPDFGNSYLAGTDLPPLPVVYSPPPSATEAFAFTPARGSRGQPRTEIITSADDYNIVNRDFDGRAVDPESGRMYEYNTKTNERQWIN